MINVMPQFDDMRKTILISVAFATMFIMLFGCAGNTSQAGNQSGTQAGPVTPAHGQNQSSGEGQESAGNTSGATGQPPTTEPAEPQGTEVRTYSAQFAGLIAMGIPLDCDISYTYAGKPATAKLYIGEDSEFRVESSVGMVQCKKTITVIRGTRQYVGCSDKQVMPSCDWFKSAYDEGRPGVASNFDFSGVPASSISCKDWTIDKSMFVTEGTSCELG